MPPISIDEFQRIDIRVGTIRRCEPFPQARKPWIDFGDPLGERKSSAQLTRHYRPEELIGRQVLAVVNFPPRQIATFLSEVLVLGLPDAEGAVVLVAPERPVPNGARLF